MHYPGVEPSLMLESQSPVKHRSLHLKYVGNYSVGIDCSKINTEFDFCR